jgi:hypothetical protein
MGRIVLERKFTMKKAYLFISMVVLMTLACGQSVMVSFPTDPAPVLTNSVTQVTVLPTQLLEPATPTPEVFIALTQAIPATMTPDPTATAMPISSAGTMVTYSPLSLVIPSGVATGASGSAVPRLDSVDAAYWQKTPGHLQVMLGDYYVLKGKSLQPQIYVYPALGYAEMVPAAFESIHRLDNILYGPGGLNINEPLPAVPFFNAAQVFASNVQAISFQGGSGVRFLTEYAQYPASANNHDLFYQFQGLTRDGQYYIVAILPITAPMLVETSDAGAVLPSGGVPYPYMANPNADMKSYYVSVTNLLNATPSEAFTPTINQLDALIQSMRVAP